MKKTFHSLVLISAILFCTILNAQTSSLQKVFKVDMYDVNGMAPYHQSGGSPFSSDQIVSFSAHVADPNKHDIVILKIDSSANILNTRILTKDPNFHDWSRDFMKLGNNYYMTGSSRAFDTTAFSYESSYLLKFDNNLNVLAQTNYFLPGRELFGTSIASTSDNNILLSGSSVFASNWSSFLMKTDTTGNIIWFKLYSPAVDVASVRELSNGDIMIVGSYANDFQMIHPTAIRFDNSGNVLWAKSFIYATGPFDIQNSLLKFIHDFGNGRILLAGRTDFSGAASLGSMDSYALMIDNPGNIIWSKTFGESQNDWAYDFALSTTNELVISGGTGSFFNFSNFGFVQYIDTSGTLVSSYAFGDTTVQEQITLSDYRQISSVKNTVLGIKNDGNFFNLYAADFSNTTSGICPVNPVTFQSLDASSYPVSSYFVLVDTTLIPSTNSDTFNSYQGITDSVLCINSPTAIDENNFGNSSPTVYPNPTNGELSIDLGANYNEGTVKVRNLLGQDILIKTYRESNILQLNIPGEAGVYFIEIISADKIAILKVMKE